ncbi:MAG: hypothetical protein J5I59_05655 [Saprospiraceae bacterium]|nr:hypothetical protein [Saprospiraceae bacterium]
MKNLLFFVFILGLLSCSKDASVVPNYDQVRLIDKIELRAPVGNRTFYKCPNHKPYVHYDNCECDCFPPAGDCLDDVVITATQKNKVIELENDIDDGGTNVASRLSADRSFYDGILGGSSYTSGIIDGSYTLGYTRNSSNKITYFQIKSPSSFGYIAVLPVNRPN